MQVISSPSAIILKRRAVLSMPPDNDITDLFIALPSTYVSGGSIANQDYP